MKAAVLYEPLKPLRIEELEIPSFSEDEVLIKVSACGVCHTDLKVVEGHIPCTPPSLIGHETSGTIEAVGKNQRAYFAEGDRVIIGTRYKCGQCRYCRAGRDNLCTGKRPTPSPVPRKGEGLVNRWNVGGFAQYVAVPGYMVFRLPAELPLEEASLVGCRVTTAYNAVKHGACLEAGESALVIGCGGVGLNTIQFLKCFGAYPIIAVDLIDEKLEAAKQFGATHTINAKREDPVKTAREISDGGVDKAFEAIGNTKTADQIVAATRPGGTAVIIGGLGRVPLTISDATFAFNEIKVTGVAMRRANDVLDVLGMIRNKRIELKPLITKVYPCEDINQALEDLDKGRLLMGTTLWN